MGRWGKKVGERTAADCADDCEDYGGARAQEKERFIPMVVKCGVEGSVGKTR